MAVSEYYQVKWRQHTGAHILENVMNYVQTTAGSDANFSEGLANAWDAYFIDVFAAAQSALISYDYIDVINLNDPEDNYRMGVAEMSNSSGDVNGERLAYWNAVVWTKTPVNRTFKAGLFRLRGVIEGNSFSEQINDEALAPYIVISGLLDDNLTTTDGSVFHPIILRKVRIPADPELDLVGFDYFSSNISGINLKGLGHLVNNK